MKYYIGLDVSLELTAVCVVNGDGEVIVEAKVLSEPDAVAAHLQALKIDIDRVGLEAGPLSQWLHAGLVSAGFDAVLLETRHVKAALSAMTVKTDRRDARGIAQLLRMGWYRPVHVKTLPAQEVRAMLVARKQLLGKLVDVELSIRGLLRNFGLKVGKVTRKEFEGRVRELAQGQPSLELIADAMLAARNVLLCQFTRLHNAILQIVRKDDVCARLMSIPGVGALTALTFRTAIDDPTRITKSRDVGPLFGLTPRRYQSGETDVMGRISKAGDGMVRTALYEAANSMLTRSQRMSALKAWALNVARRRGHKRALVALARKLAVVMHRMWIDGTTFLWSRSRNPAMNPVVA
jgi:transposase